MRSGQFCSTGAGWYESEAHDEKAAGYHQKRYHFAILPVRPGVDVFIILPLVFIYLIGGGTALNRRPPAGLNSSWTGLTQRFRRRFWTSCKVQRGESGADRVRPSFAGI